MAKKYLLAGLGYGDEGKGTIVDFLTEYTGSKINVRYNGGPQAAHHVVNNGITHCFSQFGSGTFIPNVITYLSKYMLVDPLAIENEAYALQMKGITDCYQRLILDKECIVVTPMQKIVGQIRELSKRNGSCGLGVGETVRDSEGLGRNIIRIDDLFEPEKLKMKIDFIWRVKLDQAEQLAEQNPNNERIREIYGHIKQHDLASRMFDLYKRFSKKVSIVSPILEKKQVIFEGAQGILLDKEFGFWPYVTKTNTTFDNALKLINDEEIIKIGILRAYSTRHGLGPFVSEDKGLTDAIPDMHNKNHKWQGNFRIGWLDIIATKYALEAAKGVDFIALTNLDKIKGLKKLKLCIAYEYDGKDNIDGFFDYESISGKKFISRIKLPVITTIESQAMLARHLSDCKPAYLDFNSLDNYLEYIESKEGLKTKINIFSEGPERKDKRVILNI